MDIHVYTDRNEKKGECTLAKIWYVRLDKQENPVNIIV
jgi:hypothetical protein